MDSVRLKVQNAEDNAYRMVLPARLREAEERQRAQEAAARKRGRKGETAPVSPQGPAAPEPARPSGAPVGEFIYARLGSFYEILLMASFVPFLVYFMLSWRDHINRSFLQFFRGEGRLVAARSLAGIAEMVRAFVVGNFLLGLLLSVLSAVGFSLIHLPYPLLVGSLSGGLSLVPYVGLPLALLPPMFAALNAGPGTSVRAGGGHHGGFAPDCAQPAVSQSGGIARASEPPGGDVFPDVLGVSVGRARAPAGHPADRRHQGRVRQREGLAGLREVPGRLAAMLPFRLAYHEHYDLRLGDHVFPSKKYKWLHDRLVRTRFASWEDFVAPEPSSDEDLLLAHDEAWVSKLKTGALTYQDILRLEIPYSRHMVESFRLAAGGTTLAARLALHAGVGFNLGGGFHHGFADHGEGFCAINDIAVAVRRLQRDGAIRRAMVVDCDVHHGNGTAAIFAGDPAVFTLSIHQFNNYPSSSRPPAWTSTWPTGWETPNTFTVCATDTTPPSTCSSPTWCSMWPARTLISKTSSEDSP